MSSWLYVAIGAGLLAVLYGAVQTARLLKASPGDAKMQEIAAAIQEGAQAYLNRQYTTIAIVGVVVVAVLAFFFKGWEQPVGFALGAILSGLAGFAGMLISVRANVRTAQASSEGLGKGLSMAFTSGAVTGMLVAGFALLGVAGYYALLLGAGHESTDRVVIDSLVALGFGASLISIFARLGGGIFTKGADVGGDLVGKVEAGIPEDDPRNAATIADNVGDNVGDVAGMGADLFGSYVATVLATIVLGQETQIIGDDSLGGFSPIVLPMLIAGLGILFSIIGTLFVRISDTAGINTSAVQKALNMGNWGSMVLTAIAAAGLVYWLLPEQLVLRGIEFTKWGVLGAIGVGLAVGALMSIITEYYTAMGKRPVMSIIKQSSTGHATNVIGGLAIGMESTFLPILVLAGGIWGSYECAGLYGVAIAAAGMMATTAMQLAIDAFGPIADNAGGIAEMSELPPDVREKTDVLDAVGNTTAATGKGFAIASAALTALALFAAFVGVSRISGIDIYKANVLACLFVGGMIPFIFSSLAIRAVGQAAMAMVEEVRRQFRTIPGIMEGTGKPEYDKCVAISTQASIKKMMLPGAIAIVSPIIIGFLPGLGAEALGGFLAGATVSGVLMGMFQNNAGGAWDNAKKSFEKGVEINGQIYYKKSEPHKASVTGDTVGDPFKDTSGPSMNILIKLMSIVSLVIAPTLAQLEGRAPSEAKNNKQEIKKEVIASLGQNQNNTTAEYK